MFCHKKWLMYFLVYLQSHYMFLYHQQDFCCMSSLLGIRCHNPCHTRKHTCWDSRDNLLRLNSVLLVFCTYIYNYHFSSFGLNWIFYHQILISIHMKYDLQVLLIHLFIFFILNIFRLTSLTWAHIFYQMVDQDSNQ